MQIRYPIAALAVVLAGCSPAQAPPSSPSTSDAPPPKPTPVVGSALAEPIPVLATDGRVHLAYELMLTNTSPSAVTLDTLSAISGDRKLLTLTGDSLKYWTRVVGNPAANPTLLRPGQSAYVWLDVFADDPAQVPTELDHELTLRVATPAPPLIPPTLTESVAPVSVQTRAPASIAPPLAGDGWLDANSCCDMTPHRMAINPINGKLWAAERFGIDYVQLGPDGRIFHGDRSKNTSFPYYGAEIRAVAPGPVVAVLDGLDEQIPGIAPNDLTLPEYGGNHIVQDIGDGIYAFYAHMQPNSLKATPGDQLETGQVIGNLGNSGNSDAPHLHFHLMDGPDPLMSNGLPFTFGSFRLDSRLTSLDAADTLFDGKPAARQPGFAVREETDVSPLVLDVMSYATS